MQSLDYPFDKFFQLRINRESFGKKCPQGLHDVCRAGLWSLYGGSRRKENCLDMCPACYRAYEKFAMDMLRDTKHARAARSPLPPSVRFAILKRDAYRCRLCGAAARDGAHIRLEVDHITPRAEGGANDECNLWTLCLNCNRGKGKESL